jgi:hypothetical protein
MSESKRRLQDKTFTKKTNEANSIINSVLGFDLFSIGKLNDAGVRRLEKQADDASTQNKRARQGAKHFKKLLHSRVSLVKITNGLLREGLNALKSIRREESKTVKHLAKTKNDVRLIDQRTSKAIEVLDHATNAEIGHINQQAETAKSIIDVRYKSLSQFTQASANEQKAEIGSRGQKRIAATKKPWRS